MKSKNKRLYGQALLLIFLTAVFLISSLMIYLGATRFRSMLPIFQLLDGYNEGSLLAPKPDANPGVADLEPFSGVQLYMILDQIIAQKLDFGQIRLSWSP